MTRNRPPQCGQIVRSIANTRRSRSIQVSGAVGEPIHARVGAPPASHPASPSASPPASPLGPLLEHDPDSRPAAAVPRVDDHVAFVDADRTAVSLDCDALRSAPTVVTYPVIAHQVGSGARHQCSELR